MFDEADFIPMCCTLKGLLCLRMRCPSLKAILEIASCFLNFGTHARVLFFIRFSLFDLQKDTAIDTPPLLGSVAELSSKVARLIICSIA